MTKAKPLLQALAVHQLKPGRYQPRVHFEQAALAELAQSIRTAGLLQPIIVRPLAAAGQYEIIAGERRWRAAQLAGLEVIDCLVNAFTDEQAAQAALIENINRADLDPIEEAKAYENLITHFDYTHEEIAATVGKTRSVITHSLRLLTLAPTVQTWVSNHQLSVGHAKVLVSIPTALQKNLAQQCVTQQWSVRQLEHAVKQVQATSLITAPLKQEANLAQLEKALADYIGCEVKLTYAQGRGAIKINFQSLDIFEGILDKIGFKSASDT